MMNEKIAAIELVANMHEHRILEALSYLSDLFPVSEQSIQSLSHDQVLNLEMFTSRFAKLQDYLGSTVIDLFFEVTEENVKGFTMIDKLNTLEKLHIIPDAHLWRDMRKARNIIEHEYPDNPQLIANTLNDIYELYPTLISIKNHLFKKIRDLS